jgi:hypothetical protein
MSAKIVITQTETGWTVSGSTFDMKDHIKAAGGKWQPNTRTWFIEATKDIASLLKAKADDEAARATAAIEAKAAKKAKRAFDATPEGQMALRLKRIADQEADRLANKARVLRALAEKNRTDAGAAAYYWICCESCEVIDWARKHTSCKACATFDGQSWNTFRVRGSIFTGD